MSDLKPHQLAILAASAAGYPFFFEPGLGKAKDNLRCIECKCDIPQGKSGRKCKACRDKEEKE
jgi:hypothetical protein